ncbi:MAG: SMC-Scp complex subunit ScpB [Candidatus Andersenbacteria bacterium]
MDTLLPKLEALLFLAGEAVSFTELARLLNADSAMIKTQINELKQMLAAHGLTIVTTDTHAQLTTSPTVSDFVTQYITGESQDISAAAAETLALVAYRGPISRYDIDAIRGVDSRRMIRQLALRGLIRATTGESGVPRYVIAPEFLEHLGLTDRSELPRFAELSTHEKITALLKTPE